LEIRLLEKGYKNNEQFYKDFIEDQVQLNEEYFSNVVVHLDKVPDFPIYIAQGSEAERKELFLEAFRVLTDYYLDTDRDVHLNELFWHSLLITKREYLLENYPKITEGINHFNNIVLKKFDWENYIYKSVLGAQYINDFIKEPEERERYYSLLVDNLDIYNYIIKYEIFRNDRFLINILDIIDELDLSKTLKSKIKDRDDLGKDERVGRRVIFEFNKSYPVIMSPMLEKEELKPIFLKYLSYYYDSLELFEEV
jgi:hypothetical protein